MPTSEVRAAGDRRGTNASSAKNDVFDGESPPVGYHGIMFRVKTRTFGDL